MSSRPLRYHRAPNILDIRVATKTPHTPDQSARFRTTRAAHRDETAEDYVEAIMQIQAERGEARVRDLSILMGVSHVTVTRIIKRLSDPKVGLVVAHPYKPVELTPAGKRLAAWIRKRHEIVLSFLVSLGVPARQAEIDAEGIEHHVSDATIRAMQKVAAINTVPEPD
jgi:DtxR family manganese transport transcriptional regulator